jgi:ubiquinone biosynthesis monooxygenase Coq7
MLLENNKRAKLLLMNADALILAADSALRTLFATPRAARATPQPFVAIATHGDGMGSTLEAPAPLPELTDAEKSLSAALMRVNHVGEVCAQALYSGHRSLGMDP